MAEPMDIPLGQTLSIDIEEISRTRSGKPFRARARWTNPVADQRDSKSVSFRTRDEAEEWADRMRKLSVHGIDPFTANCTLADYAERIPPGSRYSNLELALKGLEGKTLDPYMSGWRKRVKPTIGHFPVLSINHGVVDRSVVRWIEEEGCGISTIKNTIAVLVRLMEQIRRDGLREDNPARVRGWRDLYKQIEDELKDPRALAIPDWASLVVLCDALVAASAENYRGWGEVVMFAACTAARIGEVSGCLLRDIVNRPEFDAHRFICFRPIDRCSVHSSQLHTRPVVSGRVGA